MDESFSKLTAFLGILPKTPEEQVLRLLIELGIQITDADEGSLLVLDEKARELEFVMTVGSSASEKTLRGQRVPMGKGVTGLAAVTKEVQIGSPTYKDIKQTEKRGGDQGAPESVLAAPMLVNDTLIGIITAVSFREGKRFVGRDAQLYAGFATIAGLVVDQLRRLAAFETSDPNSLESPFSFGRKGKAEKEIVNSISLLSKQNPDALEHVADLLVSVRALVKEAGN